MAEQIDSSTKLQITIAKEAGFESPNILTMLKQGRTKVPLSRVGPLASALNINPSHLLRKVLEEYTPETWTAVEECLGHLILSEEEEALIKTYRQMRISH
ncbi:MAG: hypothetical protein JNJ95_12590 [Dechloromonas sp.]|nr:hypothetical protein [Dechloromonas sp.]